MDSRLITIATFDSPYEAHLLKSRLEAEGILAFIRDEHIVRMNWFYSPAIGGVKVEVPVIQKEDALKIIATDHSHDLEDLKKNEADFPQFFCPKCGSNKSESVVIGIMPTVLSWIFTGLPIWCRRYRAKCLSCGNIFKQKQN